MGDKKSFIDLIKENHLIQLVIVSTFVAGTVYAVISNTICANQLTQIDQLKSRITILEKEKEEESKKAQNKISSLTSTNKSLQKRLSIASSNYSTCMDTLISIKEEMSDSKLPTNALFTKRAWEAYKTNQFTEAIKWADKCISEFKYAATRRENELIKNKVSFPIGAPDSDETYKRIIKEGLINDVGTCYYIKGMSNLEIKNEIEAVKALKASSKLTLARCWDPKGWFWAPGQTSKDKLAHLEEIKNTSKN